jgi:hypothetical protein
LTPAKDKPQLINAAIEVIMLAVSIPAYIFVHLCILEFASPYILFLLRC